MGTYIPKKASDIDVLNLYIREIYDTPVLSAEEEVELAKKVAKGDKKSRELFIRRNLRLVVSIAKGYQCSGLSMLDLIQEGNIGLMIAVDRFDPSLGYRFSTYAANWIKSIIGRAIKSKGRNIRLSVQLYDKILRYTRAIETLQEKLKRNPTIEEIMQESNLSAQQIRLIKENEHDTISINRELDVDNDLTLEKYLQALEPTPDELTRKKDLHNNIMELLDNCNLTPRETEVLILRYGLVSGEPNSLINLAKMFNLTKQRISQIEENAINKIRTSPYVKDFLIYAQNEKKALLKIEETREKKALVRRKRTIRR